LYYLILSYRRTSLAFPLPYPWYCGLRSREALNWQDHEFARHQTRNSLFLGILDGARFHNQYRRWVEAVASASNLVGLCVWELRPDDESDIRLSKTRVDRLLLFCGVILWEALGTWSYGHAALCVGGSSSHSIIQRAFAINLALWATFMIADEVFLAYGLENVHRSIFAAQLLSLLAISLLPESNQG